MNFCINHAGQLAPGVFCWFQFHLHVVDDIFICSERRQMIQQYVIFPCAVHLVPLNEWDAGLQSHQNILADSNLTWLKCEYTLFPTSILSSDLLEIFSNSSAINYCILYDSIYCWMVKKLAEFFQQCCCWMVRKLLLKVACSLVHIYLVILADFRILCYSRLALLGFLFPPSPIWLTRQLWCWIIRGNNWRSCSNPFSLPNFDLLLELEERKFAQKFCPLLPSPFLSSLAHYIPYCAKVGLFWSKSNWKLVEQINFSHLGFPIVCLSGLSYTK